MARRDSAARPPGSTRSSRSISAAARRGRDSGCRSTKISQVEGWQDFGFRFKEGNDETEWDDAHDIITFRYTEPMTWWMPMPKDLPRTLEAALAEANRLAAKATGTPRPC